MKSTITLSLILTRDLSCIEEYPETVQESQCFSLTSCSGADVAVHCLEHRDEAAATAEEIRSLGRRAVVTSGDLTDANEAARVVDAAAVSANGVALQVLLQLAVSTGATRYRELALETAAQQLDRDPQVVDWAGDDVVQLPAEWNRD